MRRSAHVAVALMALLALLAFVPTASADAPNIKCMGDTSDGSSAIAGNGPDGGGPEGDPGDDDSWAMNAVW